jgi:hypothetical protein
VRHSVPVIGLDQSNDLSAGLTVWVEGGDIPALVDLNNCIQRPHRHQISLS